MKLAASREIKILGKSDDLIARGISDHETHSKLSKPPSPCPSLTGDSESEIFSSNPDTDGDCFATKKATGAVWITDCSESEGSASSERTMTV